jgi:hypothetical protein
MLLILSGVGLVVVLSLMAWAASVGRKRAKEYGLDDEPKPWWFGAGSGMPKGKP